MSLIKTRGTYMENLSGPTKALNNLNLSYIQEQTSVNLSTSKDSLTSVYTQINGKNKEIVKLDNEKLAWKKHPYLNKMKRLFKESVGNFIFSMGFIPYCIPKRLSFAQNSFKGKISLGIIRILSLPFIVLSSVGVAIARSGNKYDIQALKEVDSEIKTHLDSLNYLDKKLLETLQDFTKSFSEAKDKLKQNSTLSRSIHSSLVQSLEHNPPPQLLNTIQAAQVSFRELIETDARHTQDLDSILLWARAKELSINTKILHGDS